RFNEEETAEFFNQRHLLGLTAGEVALLQRHTEGWVAGLQLLGTVLASFTDNDHRAAYISHLGPTNLSIFDLLAQEVLSLQPADVQKFLLQTSVLLELTPENCQIVTQNSVARKLLADAYRRNLFLRAVSSDSRSGPFRYHDLFRDFLQQKLQEENPGLWRELHGRAATAAANAEQKLLHLQTAELWDEAADQLEAMGQRDSIGRIYRRIVVDSILALPGEVVEKRPWLQLYVAQYYSFLGQIEAAAPWLAQALIGFQEQGDEVGELEILTARAMTDALETDEIVSAFRSKIATSGHLLRPDHWMVYHAAEQWHALANHDWATLTEHLQTEIQFALESNDPGAMTWAMLSIGPEMLFNDAGIELPEQFSLRCQEVAGDDDWLLRISSLKTLASIRYYQGRVEEAQRLIDEARRLLDEIGGRLVWVDDHISWLILALALTRRSYHAFDGYYASQVERWQTQDTAYGYMPGFLYLRGRSLWLRDRVDEAAAILSQLKNLQGPGPYGNEDKERIQLLAGLIAMSRGSDDEAEEHFRQALRLHQKARHTLLLSHPGLALVTHYVRRKRWREAMVELQLVINELKTRGLPGVILQEGESIVPVLQYTLQQNIEEEMLRPLLEILQPDAAPQPVPLPDSDQYLTARENEVLQLLATGATNKEIAAELFITERTVKSHVTRILAKLEATTRTEAVTKAGRLGLI
ncbi:MAG: LuxR C-terminal-related transcriptional regulator, partial [Candidatus Promineifilaceae bacterium]|nr:LuxR C-terminal-related transcriptional regulator [Candidatus Promineifilaceae bacterium]